MRRLAVTRRALKRYASYSPKYFPLRFLMIVFERVSPYFNFWMSAEIVNALYAGEEKEKVYRLVFMALMGNLLVQLLQSILGLAVGAARGIREDREAEAFYQKTLSLDYDKLEDPEIRKLRGKIRKNAQVDRHGVQSMGRSLEALAANVVEILFSAILFAEMVSLLAKAGFTWLGIGLLAALVGLLILIIVVQSRTSGKAAGAWEKAGNVMMWMNCLSSGYDCPAMDNRIYKLQDIMEAVHKKEVKKYFRAMSKANGQQFLLSLPEQVLLRLSEWCAYLIVCFYCALGIFPVGSAIKYVGYLGRITGSVGGLFYCISSLKNNERFLVPYLEYFDLKNDMYQGSLAVEKRSDKQFLVEFKNVSFRYPGAGNDALKDINLKIKVGERLAVVGENGSGKTTFIKLLCRLYDPTQGEIIMNDFNIRKYDYREYLDLFSVVFQDYNLLAVPLGSNVASAAGWEEEKVGRLLYKVGFGGRYEKMEAGLATPLYKEFDEEGVELSGGEAQKVALARALYKDAPFIILDEPTAALDPLAEAEIYAKFDEIVEDKTAIYISHRLSSCRFCDKIAVFDHGRIVQVGTHEGLLCDKGGKYYGLWQAQAQYYT